jgi:hypothetical protein
MISDMGEYTKLIKFIFSRYKNNQRFYESLHKVEEHTKQLSYSGEINKAKLNWGVINQCKKIFEDKNSIY